jgi:hypothetical protein
MRVLLLVTALSTMGSLIGVAGASASTRLPADSATPPVPTSSVSPDNNPNTVTYCVDNYAPNSTVSVTNNANGATGTIHTDSSGHGCTHMPIKTDCTQNVSNTIVASGTDQAGKPASSQATYVAPPNSKDCASPTPTPTHGHHHCQAPSTAHLSDYSVPQGSSTRGTACGFTPFETVAGFIHSQPVFIGSTTADSNGSASMVAKIPNCMKPGSHTFMLEGESSGHQATATFQVQPSSACTEGSGGSTLPGGGTVRNNQGGGGGGLAFTGADIAAMVIAALLLLVVGTLLVVSARRRRTASTVTAA